MSFSCIGKMVDVAILGKHESLKDRSKKRPEPQKFNGTSDLKLPCFSILTSIKEYVGGPPQRCNGIEWCHSAPRESRGQWQVSTFSKHSCHMALPGMNYM